MPRQLRHMHILADCT